MSETIFHITSRDAWDIAQRQGRYSAPSLMSEGFIHCSTQKQVLPVADKFYKGKTGLVLLVIDLTHLSSDLKWEPPFEGTPPPGVSDNDAFPHIYGPINLGAIIQVIDLIPTTNGSFVFPSLI